MLKRIAFISALSLSAGSAMAQTDASIARKFELKDGSTVIIFRDGKMSLQDKLGWTAAMEPGHVMDAEDGQRIIMIGNEIARLESVMETERGGKSATSAGCPQAAQVFLPPLRLNEPCQQPHR